MAELMKWATKQTSKIDLKELDNDGGMIHTGMLNTWGSLLYDIDQVLFEELINMLDGPAATMRLELTASKSGFEA